MNCLACAPYQFEHKCRLWLFVLLSAVTVVCCVEVAFIENDDLFSRAESHQAIYERLKYSTLVTPDESLLLLAGGCILAALCRRWSLINHLPLMRHRHDLLFSELLSHSPPLA